MKNNQFNIMMMNNGSATPLPGRARQGGRHRRNNNPANRTLLDWYDETTIFDAHSFHLLLEDPGKAWNPKYQTLYVDPEGEELIGQSFGETLKQVTEMNGNRLYHFEI